MEEHALSRVQMILWVLGGSALSRSGLMGWFLLVVRCGHPPRACFGYPAFSARSLQHEAWWNMCLLLDLLYQRLPRCPRPCTLGRRKRGRSVGHLQILPKFENRIFHKDTTAVACATRRRWLQYIELSIAPRVYAYPEPDDDDEHL